MLGKLYQGQDCAAARTLELVGERWSLLILRDALFRGHTRFSEFERSLGVATNILAKRLESFVAAGIMQIEPETGRRDSRRYVLTARGLAFRTVLMALTEWGDEHVGQGPIEFVDKVRDEPVALRIARNADGSVVDLDEVGVRLRT